MTNRYPFVTKRQVLERLAQDPLFLVEMLGLLHDRTLARGDGASSSGPCGFSSSDRPKAARIYEATSLGQADDNIMVQALAVLRKYARQITVALRLKQLDNDKSLRPAGFLFGIMRPSPIAPTTPTLTDQPPEAVATTTATTREGTEPEAPAPRKRGRPKGAKNRPRTAKKKR
jgi:hypothetical protein